jgi:hypothetical protein
LRRRSGDNASRDSLQHAAIYHGRPAGHFSIWRARGEHDELKLPTWAGYLGTVGVALLRPMNGVRPRRRRPVATRSGRGEHFFSLKGSSSAQQRGVTSILVLRLFLTIEAEHRPARGVGCTDNGTVGTSRRDVRCGTGRSNCAGLVRIVRTSRSGSERRNSRSVYHRRNDSESSRSGARGELTRGACAAGGFHPRACSGTFIPRPVT